MAVPDPDIGKCRHLALCLGLVTATVHCGDGANTDEEGDGQGEQQGEDEEGDDGADTADGAGDESGTADGGDDNGDQGDGADDNGDSDDSGEGDSGDEDPDCEADTQNLGRRSLRALNRRELARTLTDLLHIDVPLAAVEAMPVDANVDGWENDLDATVVSTRHLDTFLRLSGELVAKAYDEQSAKLLPCDPGSAGCEEQTIRSFGQRALRRPLRDDELEHYQQFFSADLSESDFAVGAQLVMRAMLLSTDFLYRSELGQPDGDGRFVLDGYERASALSYLFWGSMPDEALFSAAKAGDLDDVSGLEAHAKRLFDDPRGQAHLAEFAHQWLETRSLLLANKDMALYPSFTHEVREAMAAEQAEFLRHVVFEAQGSFEALFAANYTFANRALADFYGLSGPSGSELEKVAIPDDHPRGGLLSSGAVLASHAHSDGSSPILRGLFVRERMMCQTIPSPDASIDTTPPGLDPTLTTRERFRKHTESAQCQHCHQYIDGLGFGFEGFDGVGGYRTQENGLMVDESGTLLGVETLDPKQSHDFNGPRELGLLLADSDNAQHCMVENWYRYAVGHEVEASEDLCGARALSEAFFADDLNLRSLMLGIVTLPHFVQRRSEEER